MSIRDPFYNQIEAALGAVQLDTELFERLAAELVESKGFPTNLVVGGADNGYDFELVDTELEPGPGVVTTSDRVLENLKRNLERHKVNCPHAAKKTYVVTSSVLTPIRRENLKKASRERGYTCLGVSDSHEVARYIYAHSHWARDLLGLDGRPSPLSVVPINSRLLVDVPIMGRQEAEERLRALDGDAMLVGTPGSGKTALLTKLVADNVASFMVTTDMAAVANAIREQSPEIVIIDDLEDVTMATRELVHLRENIYAEFKIIVTDWEMNPVLQQALGLSNTGIIELDRLTRDEIVAVIKSVGIVGPTILVREIVDQAEGIPGLAVTLSQAALAGDYGNLFEGNKLGALMDSAVNRLLGGPQEGNQAILALGAIALAGDAGLALEELADFVRVSRSGLQGILRRLTTGGIIRSDRRRVSLRPRPLRRYMIRKAFFDASPADYTPLIKVVPDFGKMAKELVLASRAGATVSNLLELVIDSESIEAARYFTGSGNREARELLGVAPSLAIYVANEALHTAPELIIPMLLDLAMEDTNELHNTPEHPIRLIKEWANAGKPGRNDAVGRKLIVVQSSLRWAANGGDFNAACRACAEVLRTVFEDSEMDPGAGRTFTITRAMLTSAEIEKLGDVWADIRTAIEAAGEAPWPSLLEACGDLINPHVIGDHPEAAYGSSRRLGESIILDLGELASAHPGVLDSLNSFRRQLGHDELFAVPEDYAILFGEYEGEDYMRDEEERLARINEMAEEWAGGTPAEFAARLKLMQGEANIAGRGGFNYRSLLLCSAVAENIDDAGRWLEGLVKAGVRSAYILPFLEKAVEDYAEGWEEPVLTILGDSELESAAVEVSLRAPGLSEAMWKEVSPMLPRYHRLIDILCLRDQVSQSTLHRLLQHESAEVTHATAVGMWNRRTRGEIQRELRNDWEDAIVRIDKDEYWLAEILVSSPRMAARWLRARIENGDRSALWNQNNVKSACQGLDREQRLDLLHRLRTNSFQEGVIASLIGESDELYREVLRDHELDDHWEHPLQRVPDDKWRRRAGIALKEGKTPQEVAAASMLRVEGWAGPYSEHLQSKIDEYSVWLDDPDVDILEVASHVIEGLSELREQALAEERQEAIEGLG